MNRFTHFELVTPDLEKTSQFYRDVFGWQIDKWDGPFEYYMITTGDETTIGLNGGLMHAEGMAPGTINTVQVDDIDAALSKALAHGAELMIPKGPIPGMGWVAYVRDNCGIAIGIFQEDRSAGQETAS
jgi:predicted enzyme related to lactoylglutathione lyase